MSENMSSFDPFAVLEFLAIPAWIYNPEGLAIAATNEAAVQRYGYSREEFSRMTVADLYASDDSEPLVTGPGGVRRHRLRDGSILFVDVNVRAVRVLGREWRVKTAYDVTPLHRTEEQLQQNRALLADAESIAHLGSFVAGIGLSAPVEWSAETYRIHGVPLGIPVTVSTFVGLVHSDDRDRVRAHVEASWRGDVPDSIEFRIVRPDGSTRTCVVHSSTVRDAHGKPIRILGTVQDITERRALDERLALADRMATIGTLAAGIAHELNNPLSYVTTNALLADELLREISAPADVLDVLSDVRLGTDRMAAIVRGLRLLSRPQQDETTLVDVSGAIDVAVRMALPVFRRRAKLVREDGPIPRVRANETRLTQAILNLVVNAGQAIEEGAYDRNTISVRTCTLNGQVVIEVQDTGSGMSSEVQKRIFDPFFTTKPTGVGTGLGLAIVRQIVVETGGQIEVESAPGKGSLFRITLPGAQPGALDEVKKRRRILSIDDDPLIGNMLRRQLRECEVIAVHSAREAIVRLEMGEHFDAIITDLCMPTMGGFDFYRAVRARDRMLAERILFLSVSTSPDEDVLPAVLRSRLLSKTAGQPDLLAAIERACNAVRPQVASAAASGEAHREESGSPDLRVLCG